MKPDLPFRRTISLDELCSEYYTVHMNEFGQYIRDRREWLRKQDPSYSVRKMAARIGVEPAYLSKIERGEMSPPSEEKIRALAGALEEDPDILLALGGKISTDLREVIMRRPKLFADLIRTMKEQPDHALLKIVREVRDGNW